MAADTVVSTTIPVTSPIAGTMSAITASTAKQIVCRVHQGREPLEQYLGAVISAVRDDTGEIRVDVAFDCLGYRRALIHCWIATRDVPRVVNAASASAAAAIPAHATGALCPPIWADAAPNTAPATLGIAAAEPGDGVRVRR